MPIARYQLPSSIKIGQWLLVPLLSQTEGKFGDGLQKRHKRVRLQKRFERSDGYWEKEGEEQRLSCAVYNFISYHSYQN